MTTINDLPNEMLIEILSYIHVQERQRLVTVCSRWETVIQSMWRNINKLIIKIGAERSSYGEWEGAKWANILCKRISGVVKVLGKFHGTLTKLDLEYDILPIYPACQFSNILTQLVNEIQKNEQLTSVRIGSIHPICRMQRSFLVHLPKKNLQHFSLYLQCSGYSQELIDAYESLMKATSLKYLHLKTYRPYMHKMLHKMDTLESLHIGDLMCIWGVDSPPLRLSWFPNLKELTIHNHMLTNNQFFHSLGTTPNSLHALEISVPSHAMLSQDAFECITNLRNLSYLSLSLYGQYGIEILRKLRNLDELYIKYNYKIQMPRHEISMVENLLVKLENLKQCWFYNDEIHEALTSGNFLNEAKLEEPEELSWTVWKRIFGFPQNHSKEKCCLYN